MSLKLKFCLPRVTGWDVSILTGQSKSASNFLSWEDEKRPMNLASFLNSSFYRFSRWNLPMHSSGANVPHLWYVIFKPRAHFGGRRHKSGRTVLTLVLRLCLPLFAGNISLRHVPWIFTCQFPIPSLDNHRFDAQVFQTKCLWGLYFLLLLYV